MPGRATTRTRSPTTVRAHVRGESDHRQFSKMSEELPILKGILNGVVNYHNARMCLIYLLPLIAFFLLFVRCLLFLAHTFILAPLTYITFFHVKVTLSRC